MYKSFALLIAVVLELNNSASVYTSVCLNKFHVATCAGLNLVCLHRATLLGMHLADKHELKVIVEQNNAVYQNTNPYLVRVLTVSSLTQHQGMNDINSKGEIFVVYF